MRAVKPPAVEVRHAGVTLSVVVCFFDMRGEARRALHSLTSEYQRGGLDGKDYEVIAIDNGSTRPLDPARVEDLGPQFRHLSFDPRSPSPCTAINLMAREPRGDPVTCCIDGARILSPGILRQTLFATRRYSHPFVYCLSMHLGPQCQNESIMDGCDQATEDALLATIDSAVNCHAFFSVSSPAPPTVRILLTSGGELARAGAQRPAPPTPRSGRMSPVPHWSGLGVRCHPNSGGSDS